MASGYQVKRCRPLRYSLGSMTRQDSTVGRAVRVLIDEGKLTSVKGWGVFVAS